MLGNPAEYTAELRKRLEQMLHTHGAQSRLAAEMGVDASQITRWRNGKNEPRGGNAVYLWEKGKATVPQEQAGPSEGPVTEPRTEDGGFIDGVARRKACPYQVWTVQCDTPHTLRFPSQASLLIKWLNPKKKLPTQCLGVVNAAGGRRVLPLDGLLLQKIQQFDKDLAAQPPTGLEFGTERLQLARYLAFAWSMQISFVPPESFELCVTDPSDGVFMSSEGSVHVFALSPRTLELCAATELDKELRLFARQLPEMLSHLPDAES